MQVAALAAEGDALDVSGGHQPDPELAARLKGVVAAGKAWEAAADAMLHARKVSIFTPVVTFVLVGACKLATSRSSLLGLGHQQVL